jgi:hypothetical protein
MQKLKTNFSLKSVKADQKPILMILNFGYKEHDALKNKTIYKPLRYYTGLTTNGIGWNKVDKVPYDEKGLNSLLQIKKCAEDVFNYLGLNGDEITPEVLKHELDLKLNRKIEQKIQVRISDYIREVILGTDTGRSPRTLTQYSNLANKIEVYEQKKNIVLLADKLNEEIYLDFREDLKNILKKNNSVWSMMKVFKSVLNDIARRYKIEVFSPTKELASFNKLQATSEQKVYMTFEQIKKVIDFQTTNERLKNTKHILITLLFTGCRYSDVFKIKPDFSYEKGDLQFSYTRYISSKTNSEIVCPILMPLQTAYNENNGEPPYRISDVKFNQYVKELVELCGIDEEVTCSFTNSHGKKEFETKFFYQFVSSHIGRRSFITNLINYMPITVLSKVTGHTIKDKSIIFGYNKISLTDNAAVFVKELKRITATHKEEFPIELA